MITYDERLDRATITDGEHIDRASIAYDRELDREHHLARLRRFAVLAGEARVCAQPGLARLARHATVSAFRDCLALGLEPEARRALAEALEELIRGAGPPNPMRAPLRPTVRRR
jgi:hypothetical protein